MLEFKHSDHRKRGPDWARSSLRQPRKGGVGKTTTVVNLATYLALAGDSVLVIDLDPQGNATSGFGLDRGEIGHSVYEAIIENARVTDLVVPTTVANLSIVPFVDLAGRSRSRVGAASQRERRLARILSELVSTYDYIVLDCPPSLGLLTVNALTAADAVVIPIQCEYYALEGLSQLIATINLVRNHLNPDLAIKGVVLTMYDPRTNLSAEVDAEVRKYLGPTVFDTIIPRSVRLSEAPATASQSRSTVPTPRALRHTRPRRGVAGLATEGPFIRNLPASPRTAPPATRQSPPPRVGASSDDSSRRTTHRPRQGPRCANSRKPARLAPLLLKSRFSRIKATPTSPASV